MPERLYQVIAGSFHVKGFSPDGDSIRFQANDPARWAAPAFAFKSQSKRNAPLKQLRIEAIDALETHYEGYGQPRVVALGALERLLALIGIAAVQYNLNVTKFVDAQDGVPGFIASAGLDGFDRPIAYVFAEEPGLVDGAEVRGEDLPIERSVNFKLAREGLVYATFYNGMETALIERFRTVIREARAAGRGLWAFDQTAGFNLWTVETPQSDVVILPKLFRRLVTFFETRGSFADLRDYFDRVSDRVRILPTGKTVRLGKLVTIDGRRIGLGAPPEDLVFMT